MLSNRIILAAVSFVVLGACVSEPTIYVHRMRLGKAATRVEGDVLKIQRPDAENYGSAQPGYFAIKGQEDWSKFWDGTGSNPRPPEMDFGRKMMLAAVTESAQAQAIRINQVFETGTAVHAYVQEVRPGEGCPMRTAGATKQDFIVIDHSDKPVHFHIEAESSSSCGEAPAASVQCHVEAPQAIAPGKEIVVQAGNVVECEATKQVRGVFAAVDHRWNFAEYPQGSAAKFTFDPKGNKVKFTVDTFGKYGIQYEVVDDAGRKGVALASVISMPSKDGMFLRLSWGGFDAGDDPETFPRVGLDLGVGNSLCSSEAPTRPSWCDAKRQGHTVQMKVNASDGIYPINVKYIDDRYAGGPHVCISVYKNGAQTADVCDKEARRAGEVWRTGVLAARTGTIAPSTAAAITPPPASTNAPAKPQPPPQQKPVAQTPPTTPKPQPPKGGNTGGGSIFNP
jgi:hypothetical protein